MGGLTVGSLFAGIGGFDLGFERAGMRSVWQCEIDPYCLRVLEKHWPDVLRVRDIRDVGAGTVPRVDVICGGFPCQDISVAGAGAGLDGEHSGLWAEMLRVIRELRPRYVVVENVAVLLVRGLERVLGDLASCGYDAEWDCIPALAVGAPHRRDRIWIVAYPASAAARRDARERASERRQEPSEHGSSRHMADPDCQQALRLAVPRSQCGHWLTEPNVGRVADGVPARVDRLRALGNALVPQIAEWIGQRILEYESAA